MLDFNLNFNHLLIVFYNPNVNSWLSADSIRWFNIFCLVNSHISINKCML